LTNRLAVPSTPVSVLHNIAARMQARSLNKTLSAVLTRPFILPYCTQIYSWRKYNDPDPVRITAQPSLYHDKNARFR